MSRVKSEGDLGILQIDSSVNSPSFDEGSSGGSGMMGCGSGLKKGPWTSAEDAILVEYVKQHGEGNWNAVQKNTGLSRCGKSCRLRWANHLRPNLKKGAFSAEEEKLIIELHAKLGNKWARMAAYLPGRTDNEIKNYWNTRLKRCQRAGLPVYPSSLYLSSSSSDDLQFSDFPNPHFLQIPDSISGFFTPDPPSRKRPHRFLQDSVSQFFLPDPDAPATLSFSSPPFPDYSVHNIFVNGYGYQNQIRRRSLSESPLSAITENLNDGLPSLEIVPCNSVESFRKVLDFDSYNDNDDDNGNVNSSQMELPSLQYTHEQDPLQSDSTGDLQSECGSLLLYTSGLLEDLVHEAEIISTGRKRGGSSVLKTSNQIEFDDNNNQCGLNLSLLDEGPFVDLLVSREPEGLDAIVCVRDSKNNNTKEDIQNNSPKCETLNIITEREDDSPKCETLTLRPDALLGSSWIEERSEMVKNRSVFKEAISALMGVPSV